MCKGTLHIGPPSPYNKISEIASSLLCIQLSVIWDFRCSRETGEGRERGEREGGRDGQTDGRREGGREGGREDGNEYGCSVPASVS